MPSIFLRFPFLFLLTLPFVVVVSQPTAAQEAPIEQQLADSYDELRELQRPLIDGMGQRSLEAIAEISPPLIDITSRIIQLDSARGGSLTREELRRIYAIRAVSNLSLGNIAESEADLQRAGREWSLQSGFHPLRFTWAYNAENWSGVVDALEFERAMAGGVEGTLLGSWEPRTVSQLSRDIGSDEEAEERFAELLVRSGWIETVRQSDRSWVFWDLFKARAGRDDEEGARDALANITSLHSFARILTDNRYAAYRTTIEAEQGADLAVGAANLSQLLNADWEESSEDVEYLLDYMVALRMEGRWQEIADRFGPIVDDLSSAIDEGVDDHLLMNNSGFFIVNYLAHAEIMLGDVESGLARMEKIVGLGLDNHPELISQAINRTTWLYELGRHDQAVSIARTLDESPDGIASDYAYGLIYQVAACSAFQQNEEGELRYWRDKLFAIEDLNPLVLLEYHLCMADEDAAAALIIAELQGDEPTDLLLNLQNMTLSQAKGPNEMEMEELRTRVVARLDVQAALADIGEIRSFALTTFYN